jgi:hypothetical protein
VVECGGVWWSVVEVVECGGGMIFAMVECGGGMIFAVVEVVECGGGGEMRRRSVEE